MAQARSRSSVDMHTEQLSPDALELQVQLLVPESGLVVADACLSELYADFFKRIELPLLRLEAGEQQKNLDTVHDLYVFFAQNKLCRTDIVHVYGGGSVCDLAAFAVSTFKRGCRLRLYPSTLLAMVDAAIGGKTGLNFGGIKNQIGSFFPAEGIVIHPEFLKTLPSCELRQGWAEMLKLALIFPKLALPSFHEEDLPDAEEILSHALCKLSLCQIDPFDKSERLVLNFGHSFGHALESGSGYRIKHGDAVAMGMIMACDLSRQMQMISPQRHAHLREALAQYPFPDEVLDYVEDGTLDDLFPLMTHDKKNCSQLRLILPVDEDFKLVEIDP